MFPDAIEGIPLSASHQRGKAGEFSEAYMGLASSSRDAGAAQLVTSQEDSRFWFRVFVTEWPELWAIRLFGSAWQLHRGAVLPGHGARIALIPV